MRNLREGHLLFAIMLLGLTFLLSGSLASAQDIDELKRGTIALELYLQDKKDHEEHCPDLEWDQPELDTYKRELKSQLPPQCKN